MVSKNKILQCNFKELDVSEDFKQAMLDNNFDTLGKLLKLHVEKIRNLPGFNSHILYELTEILRLNDLQDELIQ